MVPARPRRRRAGEFAAARHSSRSACNTSPGEARIWRRSSPPGADPPRRGAGRRARWPAPRARARQAAGRVAQDTRASPEGGSALLDWGAGGTPGTVVGLGRPPRDRFRPRTRAIGVPGSYRRGFGICGPGIMGRPHEGRTGWVLRSAGGPDVEHDLLDDDLASMRRARRTAAAPVGRGPGRRPVGTSGKGTWRSSSMAGVPAAALVGGRGPLSVKTLRNPPASRERLVGPLGPPPRRRPRTRRGCSARSLEAGADHVHVVLDLLPRPRQAPTPPVRTAEL